MKDYFHRNIFNYSQNSLTTQNYSSSQLRSVLLPALLNLADVEQSPVYHPEGDALYHSLQVFELAAAATDDPELWAAALFHDLGKAIDMPKHDEVGAQMLTGLFSDRVVWLVAHHLDLLKNPAKTRRRYKGTRRLKDLELLRRWDLAGRQENIETMDPTDALDIVLEAVSNK